MMEIVANWISFTKNAQYKNKSVSVKIVLDRTLKSKFVQDAELVITVEPNAKETTTLNTRNNVWNLLQSLVCDW